MHPTAVRPPSFQPTGSELARQQCHPCGIHSRCAQASRHFRLEPLRPTRWNLHHAQVLHRDMSQQEASDYNQLTIPLLGDGKDVRSSFLTQVAKTNRGCYKLSRPGLQEEEGMEVRARGQA